ncbi:GFA family protein [Aliamphritea spongicola]
MFLTQFSQEEGYGNVNRECLCGEIRYECTEQPVMAGHCQCKDCQKISGTGHISSIALPREAWTLRAP